MDGQWYERIPTTGYHLPAAGAPNVKDALWSFAFLPLCPLVVGALMTVTGLSFGVCVTLVARLITQYVARVSPTLRTLCASLEA